MYPSYYYNSYYFNYAGTLLIVAAIAVIAAVVFYCTFLRKDKEGKYTGWKNTVYNFFNFNRFYTEEIIKLVYVISTVVLCAAGLYTLFFSFSTGIIIIVLGNVAARISYELIMMFVILCRKSASIDRKLDRVVEFYGDDFNGADEPYEDSVCAGCESEEETEEFTCSGECGSCGESCGPCGEVQECGETQECEESDVNTEEVDITPEA